MCGQSKECRSCTAVEQNNPLSYSSQEFGRGATAQMWKITFQMSVDTPICPTSPCKCPGWRYVPRSPRAVHFFMALLQISTPSLRHSQRERGDIEMCRRGEAAGIPEIADMLCFHPPMAPSPLKSSHRKWIDLAL